MKRTRVAMFLLALLILLILGGCINLKQEMWFNADGSGKMMVDIGMSKALIDMAKSSGSSSSDPFAEFKTSYDTKNNPLLKNATPREYVDNDMQHYTVTFDVTDMLKYIQQEAQSDSSGMNSMVFTRLSNGNYSFSQKLQTSGLSAGQDLSSSGVDPAQLGSVFKDMYWTVIIHGGSIVSADKSAKISGDSVTWQIPMSQVFAAKEAINLSAEFNPAAGGGGLGSVLLIVVGIVVLLAIAAVVLFFVLRRRQATPVTSGGVAPYSPYPPAQPPAMSPQEQVQQAPMPPQPQAPAQTPPVLPFQQAMLRQQAQAQAQQPSVPPQPPADLPPVDLPPVEEPPVDLPPVDLPPVEQPPVDLPPADLPPAELPPVDLPPADQLPAADQPPTDQPPADQTPQP